MSRLAFCVALFLTLPAFATIAQQRSAYNWSCSGTTNSMGQISCQAVFTATGATDLIAVWTTWQSSVALAASVTDSSHLQYAIAVGPTLQSVTNASAQIFYLKNIGGGADTVTVTLQGPASGGTSVPSFAMVIAEYSGVDTVNPLDSASSGLSASGNKTSLLDSGNVPPANQNLLLFAGGTSDTTYTLTAGIGFTGVQSNPGSITEYQVVSGNSALQRATACLGAGASCPATPVGDWVMQMAIFRDASWAIAGAWTPVRLGHVYDATRFIGVDIGDQVNHAYASLPPGGGRIRVPPNPAGGCWQFTTQILLNASGTPALIEGDPGGGTCLIFTPTSGDAITFNVGEQHRGVGMRDIKLEGACTTDACTNSGGVTSRGIVTNTTLGADDQFFLNVQVGDRGAGFLTGWVFNGTYTTFLSYVLNSSAVGNNVGALYPQGAENNRWVGGVFAANATGVSITGTFNALTIDKASFDANLHMRDRRHRTKWMAHS
jgi:hypothetical protein